MTDKTCGGVGCDRPVKACEWCVKHNGRSQHLGYFDTPEQAGAAATAARRRHHPHPLPGEPVTLTEEAADWLNTYTDDTAHAAALAKNGDLWIAALLDEIDRLTEERDDAWAAAEEEAAQVDRLTTIRTPAEATDETRRGSPSWPPVSARGRTSESGRR